jgi:hypothetical protein
MGGCRKVPAARLLDVEELAGIEEHVAEVDE